MVESLSGAGGEEGASQGRRLTRDSGGGEAQQRQQDGGQRGPGHDGGCGRPAARLGNAGRPDPSHRAARGGRGPGSPNPRRDPAARCSLDPFSKAIFKTFHLNRINFRLAKIVQRIFVALQPASLNINVLYNASAIIKVKNERW